ncbi:uncharacterized protein LOC126278868 [Schistocerca gregaria]|uniref:uncharacterized protein LOC126278868 n=1 Tax=Schistocerca gregaria TaxID=7010 RepID=UPI00211EAF2E|nr:uncharacterized protein LOC126278868 [Schistocerca gregaria]
MIPYGKNVRTAGRPSPSEIKIQVEHLQETIGESDIISCNAEGSTKINFSVELKVFPTKPAGVDEIVSNPVLLTVLDSSQKQVGKESPKKGVKEVKVSVYGRSNLDLLPIFLGERKFFECLLLEQDKKVVGQEVITWPNLPRMLVSAEVCELMLPSMQRKFQNILHVTVESLHNLLPEMTENITYRAAIAFPTYSESLQPIYFDNGAYNHSYEPEYFKKWTDFSFLEGRANLSKYSLSQNLEEVKTALPLDLSEISKNDAPCVEWYALKRCWLKKPGVTTIFNTLTRFAWFH